MNKRQKKKMRKRYLTGTAKIRKRNKQLCGRYPFLIPRNVFTDKETWNMKPGDKPYTYTLLEEIPAGWRKAFGLQMCEEIRTELIKIGYLKSYRVLQIKEKYGGLRWYDGGGSRELHDIIQDYEVISQNVCITCGKPDVPMINEWWISPYCEDCWMKHDKQSTHEDYISLSGEEAKIPDEYSINVWSGGEKTVITRSIKDKADKIRARWRVDHDDLY